jgi:restriction system protein
MACPDFQRFMLPILDVLAKGGERKISELRELVATHMQLSASDRAERVASGRKLAYEDRCNWACTYLRQAGLVDWVRRGTYRLSPAGAKVLLARPAQLDLAYLRKFPAFVEWIGGERAPGSEAPGETAAEAAAGTSSATPEEQIELGNTALRRSVEAELIAKILGASPAFFENLVVELLLAMGYGGSRSDAGEAIGRSGDDGLDGIIKEDKLGLDAIYLQAKRYDPAKHKVSRPDVQAFAGSLEGHRARKGVFITTSTFTSEANEYVARIEKKIVLIDGPRLARLLFDHGVGVRTKQAYEVKEVDEEFFLDD